MLERQKALRVGLVAAGIILIIGGFTARPFTSPPEMDPGYEVFWFDDGGAVVMEIDTDAVERYELMATTEGTSGVYEWDAAGQAMTLVFEGSHDAARSWYEERTRVQVFEGTHEATSAWLDAHEPSGDRLIATGAIAVGVLLLIAAAALRSPRRQVNRELEYQH
jgi:hypothetical protein